MSEMSQSPEEKPKPEMGVAWRNLNVYGFSTSTDYQKTMLTYPLMILSALLGRRKKSRVDILQKFEGVVNPGEMLLVLGKPGSGCTTFLKTLSGLCHGLNIDSQSELNYHGTSAMDFISDRLTNLSRCFAISHARPISRRMYISCRI